MALDKRLLRVTIEIGAETRTYTNLFISASGTKFGNSLQGEAKITVGNLARTERDYLMTETSPWNPDRKTKRIILEAGRESTGYSTVFIGDIWRAVATQPPDIMMTFECRTGQALKGVSAATTQPSTVPLSKISADVASQLGYRLEFAATDKNISNYAFSGAALKQVDFLGQSGGVRCFVDNETLVVMDEDAALPGPVRILDERSGMIGIPEIMENGLKTKFFYDHNTRIGGVLRVQSKEVPAANGDYFIYKLGFELSNRDTPFYWIAEGGRSL